MSPKPKSLPAAAFALLLCANGAARAIENEPGLWLVGQVGGKLGAVESGRWLYAADAQYRFVDIGGGITQWLIRPAVGYAVNDRTRLWFGYGRFRTSDRVGDVVSEDRLWQQIDWRGPAIAAGDTRLRARLEQRELTEAQDTRWVLRLGADYRHPVSMAGADYLLAGVETFFDLNRTDWGGGTGMSQGRIVAGLGWALRSDLSLEAGYMNQFFRLDRREDRSNHLAVLRLKLAL